MDIEYKKLRFKARRGMLELDLLLQKYIDNNYSTMTADMKLQFEDLMELTDPELLDLLVNENNINSYKKYIDLINHIIANK